MDTGLGQIADSSTNAPRGRLDGHVAVVTGAAHGIGRAIATRLALDGAAVAVVDLLGAAADEVAADIPGAIAVGTDVTDPDAVAAMAAHVAEQLGKPSILVNNAGGATVEPKPTWDMTPDEWDSMIRLNLTSQFLVSRALIPGMIEARRGRIVTISSTSVIGRPSLAAYSSAKAGVVALTGTLARELGEHGINVNSVAPGFIRFTRPSALMTPDEVDQLQQRLISNQIIRRVGQPEDVAALVAFLVSDEAVHITGQTYTCNGGTAA